MTEKLYQIMDWPEIEGIVYSDCDHPHNILGSHIVEEGLLIQAFIPRTKKVTVHFSASDRRYDMELVDKAGFYAVLVSKKHTGDHYIYEVEYDNGDAAELTDPYNFQPLWTKEELKQFEAGIFYESYERLGAHPVTIEGVEGVYFSVWAPNAWSVSVVGDFNLWDGRLYPMRRLGGFGVFELFLPGLKSGVLYKYEVKFKGGDPALKSDPYAFSAELRPNTASVICDLNPFDWRDGDWLARRDPHRHLEQPMSIYEVHLGSWKAPEAKEQEFYNYRELAPMLADYVLEMGYTHVELMPVMEHPLDESWGYQVTGYYAPTSRYGSPQDFMYLIDYMHQKGIGVILDWVPAHFPRDTFALADFDGTSLYEHKDPRKGAHPHWGTLIFNYGRPQVSNFLISNALFWAEKYHVDGIRMDAVASMLYLDYGKKDGEWIPNLYGGNENLEAVEFLKHLNSVFKKKYPGAILIAEESTAWPQITGDVKDGSVGFDYKWNMGWMNDFLGYMQCDPYFRKHHYSEMTFSMVYAYSENFILVFSHDEVVHGKGSMLGKMPGDNFKLKLANLRVAYGFMIAHPGKKLLFMGQDFGQMDEWNEKAGIEWYLLKYEIHAQTQAYVKALNTLYRTFPALYRLDYDPSGFEWINNTDWEESICAFLRKTDKPEDTLLVLCNFEPILHEAFQVGVPYKGKYKEIFNSDAREFGGGGIVNPRLKQTKAEEWDERPNSITVKLAPLCICIFQYIPKAETETDNQGAKRTRTRKKAAAKSQGSKTRAKKQVEEIKKAMVSGELPS